MIRVLRLSFLVLSVLLSAVVARAQCGDPGQKRDVTNTGTEFLLCFEQNDLVERLGSDDGYLEIYFATLDMPSEITVTCRAYPSLHRVIDLAARSSFTYRITDDTIQYHGTSRKLDTLSNLWITSSGLPDDRVVRVVSTTPIVCYGMNHKVNTTDAFLALPKQTAGTEYRVISYPNSSLNNGSNGRPSQFAVAAFSDATQVTITPAAPIASGEPAGVPITITLDRGECVQIQTDPTVVGLDLTGSIVRSSAPVTVYGSHARAEVPLGFYRTDGQTSRDHLTEALPPVTTWGTGFVVDAAQLQSDTTRGLMGDLVRVLALDPNTSISVNGSSWTTLGANGFADTLIHGPVVIQASGPVLVAEIAHTSAANSDRGDPFMAIVPPIDQTYNDYTFFASKDPAFTLHKIMIVTDTAALTPSAPDSSAIVLDNKVAVPTSFFTSLPTPIGGKHYAITQIALQPGPHSLRTDLLAERAFTILMYGIGLVDSYGYTAGTLLKPLRGITAMSDDHPLPGIIRFRNSLSQAFYPDSMVVVMDHPEEDVFGVRVKESIYDVDRMDVAQERLIHLISTSPVTSTVHGRVLIYGHSPQWSDLRPSVLPFVLTPSASVAEHHPNALSIYPNPLTSTATVSLKESGSEGVRIELVDELGRVVRTISSGEQELHSDITFARDGLAAGCYQLVVTSQALGVREHHSLIVTN